MNKMWNKIGLLCLLLKIFVGGVHAQYREFGFGGGISSYSGDLSERSSPFDFKGQSGVAVKMQFRKIYNKKFGASASFTFGNIKGSDANAITEAMKMRNLSFKSQITELAIIGEYYIFGYDLDEGSTVLLPYVGVGLCGFRFDPHTNYNGNVVKLQPLGTEGQGIGGFPSKYSLYSTALCIVGGTKILLTEHLNVGIEVGLRRSFTDYLDDVSTIYVNYDELAVGNGVLAANLSNRTNEYLGLNEPIDVLTGSVRGNPKVKDYYVVAAVTLNVRLASRDNMSSERRKRRIVCPTFN